MFKTQRGLLLALPAFTTIMVVGFLPLCVILFWSFWAWDPTTYWIKPDLSFAAYEAIGDAGRWTVLVDSFLKALSAAAICILIGYPVAMAIHFVASARWAFVLTALFTIPFFTSYLIRAFSWRLVLGRTGLVNTFLL
ncbi:MAG: ABC transporter permease, partial [Alphaproteobacteria bacterium]